MTLNKINVTDTINQARKMLKDNPKIPPEFAAVVSVLLTLVELLLMRFGKNSKNSSIPPSQDPNRAKDKKPGGTGKKPGGQKGREAKTLKPFDNPDEIIQVPVNREDLPKGHTYKTVGHTKRQVVEIIVKRHVKEYQLEIVADENGKRYTAETVDGASRPVQYGRSIKSMLVYMSLYQMIPYGRVQEYFENQIGIPISEGTVFNCNKLAYDQLEEFEKICKTRLQSATCLNADETSINVNGKKIWLHSASNDRWAHFAPHKTRGSEAMDDIGILPHFEGIAVHDHWKAYFTYTKCRHALCNAHHLRELQAMIEAHPDHAWAQKMKDLLCTINTQTIEAGGALNPQEADHYRSLYQSILKQADTECPPPTPVPGEKKKRGKVPKTKERNLLERLRNFETETLLFMTDPYVPFTNNQAENDIRMTKVHQKISGCFRSMEGAQIFCRVRSYIKTCQKHGLDASSALSALFQGKLPPFCFSP